MPPTPTDTYQFTQPAELEGMQPKLPKGGTPATNAVYTHTDGFDATMPLDWEQQAMAPDYDEVIAAIATGEVMVEPDHTGRKRVLVVDDDITARMYLRAKLSLIDQVDVYEASSGDEAIHLSEFTLFDGVLLDINMQGQDGYAVCRAIKRNSRTLGTKVPKIYIVTSRSGVVERLRATLAGADAFMSKPPHPGQLGQLLEKL